MLISSTNIPPSPGGGDQEEGSAELLRPWIRTVLNQYLGRRVRPKVRIESNQATP
jgi:hypothetical protein